EPLLLVAPEKALRRGVAVNRNACADLVPAAKPEGDVTLVVAVIEKAEVAQLAEDLGVMLVRPARGRQRAGERRTVQLAKKTRGVAHGAKEKIAVAVDDAIPDGVMKVDAGDVLLEEHPVDG